MGNKVLLVILIYNGADYIRDCFSSLKNISYPKESLKILAIDNASTDNSVELIRNNWPDVEVIESKDNIGFAAGNNIGMQYAIDNNFDYVYLLNQDTVVQPDFLQKAVGLAETEKKIGVVQSKLLLHSDKSKINSIGNEIHYLGFAYAGGHQSPDKPMEPREITYSSGGASLFSVKALKEVGLFNKEFFMYHEDTDLGWRLWLSGYKVMIAPNSVVYHKYEFSRSIKKFYFMERNRRLVMFQNYRLATLLLILPACIMMSISMFFYSFIAGWWKENLRVYWYFLKLKNWKQLFATRKEIQAKRKVTEREVVKRFVGKIEFQDIQNPLLRYIVNPVFSLYWQIVKKIIFW